MFFGFSRCTAISPVNSDSFISSFTIFVPYIYFSCLNALERISSTVLDCNCYIRHPCLIHHVTDILFHVRKAPSQRALSCLTAAADLLTITPRGSHGWGSLSRDHVATVSKNPPLLASVLPHQALEQREQGVVAQAASAQQCQESHHHKGFGNTEMVQIKKQIWFHQ